MNKYKLGKAQARQEAIDWQYEQSTKSMSYGEVTYWVNHFTKLGKRYGLLKEFRENGII